MGFFSVVGSLDAGRFPLTGMDPWPGPLSLQYILVCGTVRSTPVSDQVVQVPHSVAMGTLTTVRLTEETHVLINLW